LFVAGCPNSKRIAELVTKQLLKLASDKLNCEILYTYKLEPRKAFPNLRALLRNFVGTYHVVLAKNILDRKKPDIVVVGDDGGINASILKLAKLRNIPTLAIQVGMLSERKRRDFTYIFRWRNYLLWRILALIAENYLISKILILIRWRTRVLEWGLNGADIIAVMGEYYKNLLIRRGVPPNRIVVIGYVLMDTFANSIPVLDKKRNSLYAKLKLKEDKMKILFLSQPLVEDNICTEDEYQNILIRLTNILIDKCQLIIKPHPREDLQKYDSLMSRFNGKLILIKPTDNISLPELIYSVDAVMTFQSTAGLLTLACRKPLIILDILGTPYENILKKYALTFSSISKLSNFSADMLRSLKDTFNYDTFIREHLYKLDGKSALRAAKLIINILQKREEFKR